MPDTSLFIDATDERDLVTFILEHGGRLVAGRQRSAGYEEISTWEAYAGLRPSERLFFVLFDCYAKCPLVSHRIDAGPCEGTYSIDQRVGGPTIELIISTVYRDRDKSLISDGSVGYYRTYYDPRINETLDAPELLVMQYTAIVKQIKKAGKLVRSQSGRKYVIGSHTYRQVKSGQLHLGVRGLLDD